MLAVLALVAVQSALAPESLLVPVPKDLSTAFARVLRRAPEFAEAPGRVLETEMKGVPPALSAYPAWIVEFRWREKGATRVGSVMLTDVPAAAVLRGGSEEDVRVDVRDGRWGASLLLEDQTYPQWLDSLERARRSAVQSGALDDLRRVVRAQEDFKDAHGGYADESALAPSLRAQPNAYERTFHAGSAKGGGPRRLLAAWAVTYSPTNEGLRAYCADSSGAVCATVADQRMPPLVGAACPKECPAWP